MKSILRIVAVISGIGLGPSVVFASAKDAIAIGDVHIIKASDMGWRTIIPTSISSSMNKTLMVNVSLECGLYTNTSPRAKTWSQHLFGICRSEVQVLVDGRQAKPGSVVFAIECSS